MNRSNSKISRDLRITKIVLNDDTIINIPYLDRKESKTFIDNILNHYNIESIDLYKSPDTTNLKAAISILKENNADQEVVNSLLKFKI